ncbi:MAG: fimbrial protein [Bacteroidales bacterium]
MRIIVIILIFSLLSISQAAAKKTTSVSMNISLDISENTCTVGMDSSMEVDLGHWSADQLSSGDARRTTIPIVIDCSESEAVFKDISITVEGDAVDGYRGYLRLKNEGVTKSSSLGSVAAKLIWSHGGGAVNVNGSTDLSSFLDVSAKKYDASMVAQMVALNGEVEPGNYSGRIIIKLQYN